MQQRFGTAREHRRLTADDFTQLQRVTHRVFKTDIAGGNGQANDFVARIVECHQQRERVVDAWIGIDQ